MAGTGGTWTLKILTGVLVHRVTRPLRGSVSCGGRYLVCRFNRPFRIRMLRKTSSEAKFSGHRPPVRAFPRRRNPWSRRARASMQLRALGAARWAGARPSAPRRPSAFLFQPACRHPRRLSRRIAKAQAFLPRARARHLARRSNPRTPLAACRTPHHLAAYGPRQSRWTLPQTGSRSPLRRTWPAARRSSGSTSTST